ncbi:MAG: restriction endonuclease [Limisphaerales bacterium]
MEPGGLTIGRTLSDPKDIEAVKKWIMEFSTTDKSGFRAIEKLQSLIEAVKNANTSDEKGRTLEELVACLFSSIEGFSVDDRRIITETEEIDLVISNGSGDPKLRREEAIILVECKNWSSKCGKNEFVEFRSKMENRKGRCSLGFLISWNGFTDTVTKEMLRGSHERLLIVPIDGGQIQAAVRTDSFLRVIMSAWNKATLI